MVSIGERITQLRKAKNWSQDELAKEVESSRVMIGKYERGGDNLPSIEVMVKLAKAFGVSVDFILGEGLNAAYYKEMINVLMKWRVSRRMKKNGYSIIWISLSEIIKLRKIINK